MNKEVIVNDKAIPTELFTIDSKAANNVAYLAKLDRSFAKFPARLCFTTTSLN